MQRNPQHFEFYISTCETADLQISKILEHNSFKNVSNGAAFCDRLKFK